MSPPMHHGEVAGGRRLLLLRHAKSSWSDAGLADRERPLNGRGRAACKQVARLLARPLPPPDRVLCSPARRARETWERVLAQLDWRSPAEFDESLYSATADSLLVRLRDLADSDRTVLLIGHNPALQDLALMLAGRGRADRLERMANKFPTAALADIDLGPGAWSALDTGAGRLLFFGTARDGSP